MTVDLKRLYRDAFGGMDQDEVLEQLQEWQDDGGCEAACPHQCWVEPDGTCEHGHPSWLVALGMM